MKPVRTQPKEKLIRKNDRRDVIVIIDRNWHRRNVRIINAINIVDKTKYHNHRKYHQYHHHDHYNRHHIRFKIFNVLFLSFY